MHRALKTGCVALLSGGLGCGSNGTGPGSRLLAVTSTQPGNTAIGVDVGTIIRAHFNRALDPATVSAATVVINDGAVDLPRTASYDLASQAVVLSAPLLPGAPYEAQLLTGIQDAGGTALPAPYAWTFTTRAWQAVAVDQIGSLGQFSYGNSLAVDGAGRVHVSYYDATNGDLKYATCAASCGGAANWQIVAVDQTGTVGQFTSLAVDGTGRVHVSYFDATHWDLKYAACAANCSLATNWQIAAADTAGAVGQYTSLAVDGTGRVHISYWDANNQHLKYATCAANCTAASDWQQVTADPSPDAGPFTSLVVDATGRVHISYAIYYGSTGGNLKYATCLASCATVANWHLVTIEYGTVGFATSLAVDANGRVHIGYHWTSDPTRPGGALGYATCASSCGTATSWTTTTLFGLGAASSLSLKVDAAGRLHAGYYDAGSGHLKYATCAAACTAPASWRSATVDQAGDVGGYASMAVDANGAIHTGYFDATNHQLKYIR